MYSLAKRASAIESQLLCTEQCNVGMSKVSRRTVDTGTSIQKRAKPPMYSLVSRRKRRRDIFWRPGETNFPRPTRRIFPQLLRFNNLIVD